MTLLGKQSLNSSKSTNSLGFLKSSSTPTEAHHLSNNLSFSHANSTYVWLSPFQTPVYMHLIWQFSLYHILNCGLEVGLHKSPMLCPLTHSVVKQSRYPKATLNRLPPSQNVESICQFPALGRVVQTEYSC